MLNKTITKMTRTPILLFLIIFFLTCSPDYREIIGGPEQKFNQGRFLEAAKMLSPRLKKEGKNKLLYLMEIGYILHASHDYASSNKILLEAARIGDVKKTSIGREIASLLTNEGETNYNGEDFERILVHMYLGINFLMLGEYESARVEFKNVIYQYSRITAEGTYTGYKENLIARYLTAVTYEITGDLAASSSDLEFAYIEYKKIFEIDPHNEFVRIDLLRLSRKLNYLNDYEEWEKAFGKKQGPTDEDGEIILIFEAGQSAIKESRGHLLETKGMSAAIGLSLSTISLPIGVTSAAVLGTLEIAEHPIPKFIRRSNKTNHITMSAAEASINTIIMNDIAETAIKTLEDDTERLEQKLAGSIVVKAVASIGAGIAAAEITKAAGGKNDLAAVFGFLAGMGTGFALFSQMKPDLRCWHTLPENLQLGRMCLKPGNYSINLDYIGHNNEIIAKKQIDVLVKKGEKVFINERTLQ